MLSKDRNLTAEGDLLMKPSWMVTALQSSFLFVSEYCAGQIYKSERRCKLKKKWNTSKSKYVTLCGSKISTKQRMCARSQTVL